MMSRLELERAVKDLLRGRLLAGRDLSEQEPFLIIEQGYRLAKLPRPSRLEWVTSPTSEVPAAVSERALGLAEKRAEGALLQYLLGRTEFAGLELAVGPGVLVPRPETEFCVDQAVADLRSKFEKSVRRSPVGLEIGLGSGAISLALLKTFSELRMTATEWSVEARAWAEINARATGLEERLTIVSTGHARDVFESIERRESPAFDFLIANPPYLSVGDQIDESVLVHEPHAALFPPSEPLFFYQVIASQAGRMLRPGAPIYLEIPHERAAEVRALFEKEDYIVAVENDLTGRPRFLRAGRQEHGHGSV